MEKTSETSSFYFSVIKIIKSDKPPIFFFLHLKTLNLNKNNRLRREYTGDWVNDKKSGRGTMFYKNEDRYDGYDKFLKDFAYSSFEDYGWRTSLTVRVV